MKWLDSLITKLALALGWEQEYQPHITYIPRPPQAPKQPQDKTLTVNSPSMPPDPDSIVYPWDSPAHNFHNTRRLCDLAGLSLSEKDILCACIFQESRFTNSAINHNRNADGQVLSTDFGICQVNDHYHIGPGKDFPSVEFVQQNPDKVVSWMIGMYQHGLLKQWVSFSSGAYREWLSPASPMWALKS